MFKVVKNTRRVRRSPSPGSKPEIPTSGAMDSAMTSFFSAESASALLKPWLRLDRGLRLSRFRVFAEEYPDLTTEEREILLKTLVKLNDTKALNTKQQIQYEDGKIVGIRGLKLVRGESGTIFKIETSRPTKRKIHKEGSDGEGEKIEGSNGGKE
jgi:hypothetical protein